MDPAVRTALSLLDAVVLHGRPDSVGNDGRSGAIVVGVLFILVGAWYLVREYLPTIDWDWFWPLVLVAVGVLVLVLAVRPRDEPGSPDHLDGGR